jgi:mono/diheme cytochrome c family protein
MKRISIALLALVPLYLGVAAAIDSPGPLEYLPFGAPTSAIADAHGLQILAIGTGNEVVQTVCVRCHNDDRPRGNLSLDGFDADDPSSNPEVAEKIIRKLRLGMMPPAGIQRPGGDTLIALAVSLEDQLDAAARANPNPGSRTFQILNRAEYTRTIRDMLDLQIDADAFLPAETISDNFDNIADVQTLSATLMEGYLRAASEISRLAVGDLESTSSETTYKVPKATDQTRRVEGAPFGTRGGTSVIHVFPADGQYRFKIDFHPGPTGFLYGVTAGDELVEISINGERATTVQIDRWMSESDPNGMVVETEPVHVRAGPQRVTAAFVSRTDGPADDLLTPVDYTLADTQIGSAYGVRTMPHVRDFIIAGPDFVTGISETPSRRKIFSCRPTAPAEETPCAEQIIANLGAKAYRRPLSTDDVADVMMFFEEGAAEGGFEIGIRTALQAILASPHFVFRLEEAPQTARPGETYRISDLDLASRLSYFLWATAPDDELIEVAKAGDLSDDDVLVAQTERMLADPRAESLGGRFAAQWLRLQDLDKIRPDALQYPYFDQALVEAMHTETRMFFNSLVSDDRSVLELITADYTYANEELAQHYGIPGVSGDHFRRVAIPDSNRRGLLGHGSVLTLTSHADRTSPVLRGKWVMEVLLGSPPPPPPPGVPDLEATDDAEDGRLLTVRERMELHRRSPACRSCHRVIDPIGLALENFDVTGRWRIKDEGSQVDPVGELYDGSEINGPKSLRDALLSRPAPVIRTFTEALMSYALGRRIEYYDMPTVRQIARDAEARGNRMSAFIAGVVQSPAFQMSQIEAVTDEEEMDP